MDKIIILVLAITVATFAQVTQIKVVTPKSEGRRNTFDIGKVEFEAVIRPIVGSNRSAACLANLKVCI